MLEFDTEVVAEVVDLASFSTESPIEEVAVLESRPLALSGHSK